MRHLILDRNLCITMGAAAKEAYLAKYTAATNETLIRIYEKAVDRESRNDRISLSPYSIK